MGGICHRTPNQVLEGNGRELVVAFGDRFRGAAKATRRERLTKGGYERVGIGSAVEFIGLPQATRAEA